MAAPSAGAGGRLRVAVLASGRGSNFLALLDAARRGALAIELVGVFGDRPEAPVLDHARDAGLRAFAARPKDFPDRNDFESTLFAEVEAVQPQLIVCAGYMRIIGAGPVRRWNAQMINIHPSLLPRHRGLHTHARALAEGDRVHGCSVHFVTEALDGGPVIARAELPVQSDDTPESLAARVLEREHPLLVASVGLFADRRVRLDGPRVLVDELPLAQPLKLADDGRLEAVA